MKKVIKVAELARVEGEGGLTLIVQDGRVTEAKLTIFESPRFFEAFLRGRHFSEAPDITARICGICPVAYQMSSVAAMETALGVEIPPALWDLRRLLYCGEWIESHVLHVYMLHAPDFLNYPDALTLARDYPEVVQRGLALKKIGNELVAAVGGREIHPVNARVGGFYRAPRPQELAPLAEKLKGAVDAAAETVRWVAGFEFPEVERPYEFVALRHPQMYPLESGRLVSSAGLDITPSHYEEHFTEEHVAHSNALHGVKKDGGAYLTGPLARYSLNFDRLSPRAQEAARQAGLGPVCRNPFQSIIVRSVETLYACEEALRIITAYERPAAPYVDAAPRAGEGWGITEAPRGILYHRYRLDEHGLIQEADIVPPTSQNQKSVEADLREVASRYWDLPEEALTWRCEQTIRNYDPCISCATHFLKLTVKQQP